MRWFKAINKPPGGIRCGAVARRLLVVFALLSLPAALVCQTAAIGSENGPVAEVKTQPLGFDPALVGLPDLPVPLSSPADFDRALIQDGQEMAERAVDQARRRVELANAKFAFPTQEPIVRRAAQVPTPALETTA